MIRGWYIGLDAGGTKTRLYARSATDQADMELLGGPANAVRQGTTEVATILSHLVKKALQKLPKGILRGIHAGVAGAGNPAIQEELVRHMRILLASYAPFHLSLSHDGVIALEGAFGGQGGLLFLAGTGSGVMARTGEALTDIDHIGGWGYQIGDEGSGCAIGKRTLAAVAHAMDGGAKTLLTELAKMHLKIHDRQSLLSEISLPGWEFQSVAPLALKAVKRGDAVAISLLKKETTLLARQAEWMIRRHPELDPQFTIIGGLSNSEIYVKYLCTAVEKIWPTAKFTQPLSTPAAGAAQIAIRQSIDSPGLQ